jgi:hypothetical protein
MSQDFCRNRILQPSNSDINSGDIDNCLYVIDDLLKDSSNGTVTIATLGLQVPTGNKLKNWSSNREKESINN